MRVAFFNVIPDITCITKWFKDIVYSNKMTILIELRQFPKGAMLTILISDFSLNHFLLHHVYHKIV